MKAVLQDLPASKNSKHLSISAKFLLGRYHGKEWPPSPKRLFLAFVAALHQNSGRIKFDDGNKALKVFERLGAPKIYAQGSEGCEYTIYVPNNDGDVIGKAYAEGKTPKDERTMTTGKAMRPRITDEATYVWEIPQLEDPEAVEVLCELAREIPVFGLGIDPVVVCGNICKAPPYTSNTPCYVADERGDTRIDVPVEGLLEDAQRHHVEFENRIGDHSFDKPMPIRKYLTHRYRKHSVTAGTHMFRIHSAGMVGRVPTNSQIPQIIEQLYRIKNEYDGGDMLDADAVVIPTIGEHSDGIVRRVAFLIDHKTDEDVLNRFVSHVSGQVMKVGDEKYQINPEDQDDPMQRMYAKKSKLWRSVLPVDLGDMAQDITESAISALCKDGITDDVVFVGSRREPYWNGLPKATGRTTYLEVEFKTARDGVFAIGKNKERGQGLFAPVRMPKVAHFVVLGDRPPVEKTIEVADLMRRAAMSKFQRCFNRSDVPSTISGHSSTPLNHSHAFWLPHDADADGMIDCIVVYAKHGFGHTEMRALRKITDVINDNMRMQVRFKRFDRITKPDQAHDLFTKSKKWKSATPYYVPWHVKKNFGVKEQIKREIGPKEIESIDIESTSMINTHKNKKIPTKQFRTKRNGKGPITNTAYSLVINFKKPRKGPCAIGYGRHFGLGLFVPVVDNNSNNHA